MLVLIMTGFTVHIHYDNVGWVFFPFGRFQKSSLLFLLLAVPSKFPTLPLIYNWNSATGTVLACADKIRVIVFEMYNRNKL